MGKISNNIGLATGAIMGLMVSSGAQAAFLTGNDLYADCEKLSPKCMGYIMGVVDLRQLIDKYSGGVDFIKYCLPDNSTDKQISLVYENYYKKHPEQGATMASFLVTVALTEAFPCPTPRKPQESP